MKIDKYQFGKINIEGKDYTHDVIIFPVYVESNWWRLQSHLLTIEDIEKIVSEKPDILFIGTGKFGLMKVAKEVIEYCKNNQIEIIIDKTENIVRKFNKHLDSKKRIVAALHLTC
ncbi:MAG: hypothetical protein H8D22_02320 [Candidatus Cloacimonetes bacterium]|nr:hypothetical protein [Candidatus Cloacimonadota bacterium]